MVRVNVSHWIISTVVQVTGEARLVVEKQDGHTTGLRFFVHSTADPQALPSTAAVEEA